MVNVVRLARLSVVWYSSGLSTERFEGLNNLKHLQM